jgi:hypothetical protein
VLGRALQKAREEALRLAGTNRPEGRGYNTAMSRLLEKYDLVDGLYKNAKGEKINTGSNLLNIMDNLAAVEEWRSKLPDPDALNHPSWLWDRFKKSSRGQDRKDRKRRDNSAAAQIKELKKEVEQLQARDQESQEEKQREEERKQEEQDQATNSEDQLRTD